MGKRRFFCIYSAQKPKDRSGFLLSRNIGNLNRLLQDCHSWRHFCHMYLPPKRSLISRSNHNKALYSNLFGYAGRTFSRKSWVMTELSTFWPSALRIRSLSSIGPEPLESAKGTVLLKARPLETVHTWRRGPIAKLLVYSVRHVRHWVTPLQLFFYTVEWPPQG